MHETSTLYETLGVGPDASQDEIKTAYRALIRKYHPDVVGPEGEAFTGTLNAAYHVLSQPDRRQEYDRTLREPAEPEGTESHDERDQWDTWGTEASWDDDQASANGADADEPLDEAVMDDSPPQPPSDSNSAQDSGPTQFEWAVPEQEHTAVRVTHPTRRLPLEVALGVLVLMLVGFMTYLFRPPDLFITRSQIPGVLIGASVAGLLVGYVRLYKHAVDARFVVAAAIGVLIIGEFSLQPPWRTVVRVLCLFACAVALGLHLRERISTQRALSAVLPVKSVRQNNIFGSLPGDVAAELVQRDCDPLYSIPGLRIVRTDDPSDPFSHTFICGTKVAFVRAVTAPGGEYWWSGPTLFRDGKEGWPVDVARGPYEDMVRRTSGDLGNKTRVRYWVVVYAQDSTPVRYRGDPLMPAVVDGRGGLDVLGRYLTEENEIDLVDQRRVVTAAEALFDS